MLAQELQRLRNKGILSKSPLNNNDTIRKKIQRERLNNSVMTNPQVTNNVNITIDMGRMHPKEQLSPSRNNGKKN